MPNLLEKLLCPACRLTNSLKFVLSCTVRDNLATKEEAFRGKTLCEGSPKPFLQCGGQACRIISDYMAQACTLFKERRKKMRGLEAY